MKKKLYIIMRLDKEKIVKLINALRADKSNKSILKALIEEVSNMVYNYPRIVFHDSEDDCGEFYLYFIERLPRFILKYNVVKSSFATWFCIVLKSHYLNFKNKQRKYISANSISLNYTPFKNSSINMMNLVSYQKWTKDDYDELSHKVLKFIHGLTLEEQVIIKLLYFNMDTELLRNLAELTGVPVEKCMKTYTDILNENTKRFDMIYKLKNDITEIRKKIFDSSGNEKLEKRLCRLREKYYNNLENFTGKNISVLLNKPLNEVYYKINKIKAKLKNRFKYIISGGDENGA